MRDSCVTALDDGAVWPLRRAYLPARAVRRHGRIGERGGRRSPNEAGSTRATSAARDPTLFAAVREALDVGPSADVPVHVSHLKLAAESVWHRAASFSTRPRAGATGDQYAVHSRAHGPGVTSAPMGRTPDEFGGSARRSAPGSSRLQDASSAGSQVGSAPRRESVGTIWCRPRPRAPEAPGYPRRPRRERGQLTRATVLDRGRSKADGRYARARPRHAGGRRPHHSERPRVMVASDSIPAPNDARWDGLRDHPRSYGTFPQSPRALRSRRTGSCRSRRRCVR